MSNEPPFITTNMAGQTFATNEPPSDSDEALSWCTRCGHPTRWDGQQWVRDPDQDEDTESG